MTLNTLPMIWTWEPSVLAGLALITLAYGLAAGPAGRRFRLGEPPSRLRQACFHAGTFLVFLALCSPLDNLGDEVLFSAHMAQHLLLTFLAPPLWLLGTPDWLIQRLTPRTGRSSWIQAIISPMPACLIFNSVMWAWHIPAAYQAALLDERIHIVEHLTFMASAVIGWAPAILGQPLNRLAPPGRALYLLASTFSCTALAALFTFSNQAFYGFYTGAYLAPLADQQAGGLLMWLTGDVILISAILVVVSRWLAAAEHARQ